MPVGEQPHQEAGNHLLLADDRLAQLGLEAIDQLGLFRHAVFDLLDVHLHYVPPWQAFIAWRGTGPVFGGKSRRAQKNVEPKTWTCPLSRRECTLQCSVRKRQGMFFTFVTVSVHGLEGDSPIFAARMSFFV